MSTTTIRLSKDLKFKDAAAAKRADFLDTADKRYANIIVSGKAIPWIKMRAYLEDRVAGKKAVRPAARKRGR